MRNGRAISKQWRAQKSGQRRAEEELRGFPCAGKPTALFAWCESHGQGEDSLRDAAGFKHGEARASPGGGLVLPTSRATSSSWRPRGCVIPGLCLGLKQGIAFKKVPGEEPHTDSTHHGGATKTTALMALGGVSPNLISATEPEMPLSHSQTGHRKCPSLPGGGDKGTLERNGAHPDPSPSSSIVAAVQQDPARRRHRDNSHPHHPLPRSNL